LQVEIQSVTAHATEIEKAFLEHHELVYKTAYRITGNASDAEDVLQTLFLRLVRREWMPEPDLGWPAYLRRASVNIALDIIRTRGRQAPLGDIDVVLPESGPDPHREYSSAELRQLLTAELAKLNPVWAEIFILRYVEGYKVQEIARMLNSTKSTIAVTLFRTRGRLQKSIRKFLGGH
jgi:RNA polymerase sigma-70 factor (ECF subfamily)